MILAKPIANRKLLLDTSDENQIYSNSNKVLVDELLLVFHFSDLKSLEEVILNDRDIELILSVCERRIKKGLISYKNEDGLKVYALDTPTHLFLFSIGEFQPSRYKMIFECGFVKAPEC